MQLLIRQKGLRHESLFDRPESIGYLWFTIGHRALAFMPDIVLTGASTGIGFAACQALIRRGFRVFGSVRKQADADRLKEQLGANYNPLIFDVTDPESVNEAATAVRQATAEQRLFGLVNNAGIAVAGPLAYLPLERFRLQIEVNLLGVHTVMQAFLPLLGTEPNRIGKPGRIVNISSVSGRLAVPFLGAYAASKFALEGYSDSLRRELVVQQFPNTPYDRSLGLFAEQAMNEAKTGFPPEKVGELICRVLTTPRPRSRYPIVPHRLVEWSIPRRLPTEFLDYCIAKFFKIR